MPSSASVPNSCREMHRKVHHCTQIRPKPFRTQHSHALWTPLATSLCFSSDGRSAQQNTLQLIGVCVCVRWVFSQGEQHFTCNDSLHCLARITGTGPDSSSTSVGLLLH
uniref:(northern house mosquito) hypothetical protein n=1 Tax=Culex pipiens TaxID=7175 RepID=A0A8D8A7R8_CULPI